MYKNKLLQSTLDSINKVRKHFELPELEKIPKGTPKEPKKCPIAVALAECGVTRVGYDITVNNPQTAKELAKVLGVTMTCFLPLLVRNHEFSDFIVDFDIGKYPWLVLKDTQEKKK